MTRVDYLPGVTAWALQWMKLSPAGSVILYADELECIYLMLLFDLCRIYGDSSCYHSTATGT